MTGFCGDFSTGFTPVGFFWVGIIRVSQPCLKGFLNFKIKIVKTMSFYDIKN